jgi:hypothetical protein
MSPAVRDHHCERVVQRRERVIQAVPEITTVVDVTNHQSGTNPYFETAKK